MTKQSTPDAHEMIDLGTDSYEKESPQTANPMSKEGKSYPRFTVSDAVLKEMQKSYGKLNVGDRMMAMCDLEVCAANEDEYGKRREFKVRGLSLSGDVANAADEKTDDKEGMDGKMMKE